MPNKPLQGEELTGYLDQIERDGMAVTRKWFGLWQQAMMYVWGEQLQGIKKNPDWDYIVINRIYPLLMQGIAKQAKNNPKILGRPWNDEGTQWAENWQGLIQYCWEQLLNMRMEFIHAILDSGVFGYAVGEPIWRPKDHWDDQQKKWLGEVGHLLHHPAGFWADPCAERIDEAENIGLVRKVSVEWAVQQWPQFDKQIREEARHPDDLKQYEYADGWMGPTGVTPIYENQSGKSARKWWSSLIYLLLGQDKPEATEGDGKHDRQFVWLRRTYFRDYCGKHVKLEDIVPTEELVNSGQVRVEQQTGLVKWANEDRPVGQEEWPTRVLEEYDKPQFPLGRYVMRIGKTVLNPKLEDQVYTRRHWPFCILPYHILPHMWQGSNAVEMTRSSQDMLNATVSYLIQHVKMSACPQKVVEEGALALDRQGKPRIIKDKAGEIIVTQKGKNLAIRNLQANAFDPAVMALIEFLIRDVETQQFMHATAQGAAATKSISATEAARLDTNAHDLVALRAILGEKWCEGEAIRIAEIVQERYDEGRRIRIIGFNGETQPSQMSPEMRRVEWDLEIELGSTLPFDEERQKNDYLAAYKLCGDPNLNPMLEECLRKLNIANRQKILARHAQMQLFKQFAALGAQLSQVRQMAQQPQTGPDGKPVPVDPQQVMAVQQQIMGQAMHLLAQAGQMASPAPQMAAGQPMPQKGAA